MLGDPTTTADPQDTTATVDPSATAADTGTTTGSSPNTSGSGSSDPNAGASDPSSSGSSDPNAAGSTASADQTPAAQLTLDPVQPASTDADTSLASSSGGAPGATPASTDTGAAGATPMDSGGGAPSVSDIIAIGTTAVKIMAASSPDYSMKSSPVAVLPQGVDPLSLTGVADPPRELNITLSYHNNATMLICNLPIVVQWRYGGSNNGVGHYITSASVFLDSGTDVGVFYKVDIDASLNGPFNAGNNVAAIGVLVQVKVNDKISPEGFNVVLEGTIKGDGGGVLRQRPGS